MLLLVKRHEMKASVLAVALACSSIAALNAAPANADEVAALPTIEAISPHRVNYILPLSWSHRPNSAPFGVQDDALDKWEVKFQLSLKVAAWEHIANRDIDLFFAYTVRAWWQAYNSINSSPFRDTNHEPELFVRARWPHGGSLGPLNNLHGRIGFNHQSNGQALPLSRSWNRLIAGTDFDLDQVRVDIAAWFRLPEQQKSDPTDPRGDDNPDISDYVGRGELSILHTVDRLSYSLAWRNNLRLDDRNRGSLRFALFFPINSRLQGYAEIFTGYGESLIDYNVSAERISVGVALNTWP